MKMKNKLYISSIFILTVFICKGQNTDTYLGIGSGQRTIEKNHKISSLPVSIDSIIDMSDVKYYLEPKKHIVTFETKPIKAAKLKIVEPLTTLYSGYVKFGAGSYLMPILDATYNSTRSKDNSWGINLLHHSALRSIEGLGNNTFSKNYIGGNYKHFLLYQDIDFSLNYTRDSYSFYGFNDSNALIPLSYREKTDTILQTYNLLQFSSSFSSRNTGRDTSKLNYKTSLYYHLLNNRIGIQEHNIVAVAEFGKFLLNEEFAGTFELDINNLTTSDSLGWVNDEKTNATSAIIKLNPHIFSRGDNWKAKVGLSLQSNINHEAKFYFYPDVECSYSLFNDLFIPYLGLKGGLQRNSMNSLRLENPYISSNNEMLNTNTKLELFGGIRGSISSTLTFNASASFKKTDNMYFFVPDTISSYENKFSLIYDKLDITNFSGQITYQKSEDLKLFALANYYLYSPLDQEFAWQMPNFSLTIGSWYDIADKIIVKGNINLLGSRNVYSYNEPLNLAFEYNINEEYYSYTLPTIIDMNLGVEYRYNSKISAFIDFNNFTASKYQRWSNYPTQSINIIGGATISF